MEQSFPVSGKYQLSAVTREVYSETYSGNALYASFMHFVAC